VNIIAKTVLDKMGLKIEPHSHSYNVNWVDKTAQSITQHCQVPIHMSSYEDRVWCDVLDKDVAHILLSRPWLYGLDVTSLSRSNTSEFKFKRKKIVLKPAKPKSNVGNNKEGTFTNNNKTPCFLLTRSQTSSEALVDRSTSKSRNNSLGLLPRPIGIKPIVTVESPVPHLHELHVHTKGQMTFINYNYQSAAKSHKRL